MLATRPLIRYRPAVGVVVPEITLRSVDLPARLRVSRTAIFGAADNGSVLGTKFTLDPPDATGIMAASAVVLRLDRAPGRVDTVTRTKGRDIGRRPAPGGTGEMAMQLIYGVEEQVILFPDGWVAVARREPYRIDWFPPGGAPLIGPVIPWASPKIDDAEKAAWLARVSASGTPFGFTLEQLPFAPVVPPYEANALRSAPDGKLLVKRARWSGSRGHAYDLVDRAGRRLGTLALPDDERVVGFGQGVVYVSVADEDGIQRLVRHRWP
jgi:hypothetical protein